MYIKQAIVYKDLPVIERLSNLLAMFSVYFSLRSILNL